MKQALGASHSILSTDALRTYVQRHYDIGEVSECRFLQLGLNDTYLLGTRTEKFILRVYRRNWRTAADIAYELDVLVHLAGTNAHASQPVTRKDGQRVDSAMAPEGERFLVLFTYANGAAPNYGEEQAQQSYLYGKAVARMHTQTDSFSCAHQRFALSLTTLISRPMAEIQPLLAHRKDDRVYLAALAEELSGHIQGLHASHALEQGFCHGDVHGGNAHFDENGEVTFFDFDACGHGWRAYDVATFCWSARTRNMHQQRCRHFLRGYTEVRPLSEASLAAVPHFVAARHIWLVGLHAEMSRHHGSGWLDDHYLDRQMKLLRAMGAECSTQSVHETYLLPAPHG